MRAPTTAQTTGLVAFTLVTVVGLTILTSPDSPDEPKKPASAPSLLLFDIPGIDGTKERHNEISLIDADEIIGVSVDDKHRAYLVRAFTVPDFDTRNEEMLSLLGRHVVNDRLGDSPICVTFCDRNLCTRVLQTDGGESSTLRLGGWKDGEMQLIVNGTRFAQNDSSLPLKDVAYEVTTWGVWKQAHPDSLVYTGI